MSRTRRKGANTCPSCAPGCKCDWCMSGVERRFERQAPVDQDDTTNPCEDGSCDECFGPTE